MLGGIAALAAGAKGGGPAARAWIGRKGIISFLKKINKKLLGVGWF
jgi:hypothetical protein